jgi:hypothetical protein
MLGSHADSACPSSIRAESSTGGATSAELNEIANRLKTQVQSMECEKNKPIEINKAQARNMQIAGGTIDSAKLQSENGARTLV